MIHIRVLVRAAINYVFTNREVESVGGLFAVHLRVMCLERMTNKSADDKML